MPFKLPESQQAYFSDTAVYTAVQHIFSPEGSKKRLALPPDIEWEELRAFHRAVLAAHQIRCEFAILLADLWDANWQPALNECGYRTDIKPLSVGNSEIGRKLDTYTLWNESRLYRVFDVGEKFEMDTGVWVDEKEIKLRFSFWGGDNKNRTTCLDLGDDWLQEEIGNAGDVEAYTRRNLARIRDNGTIDLSRLRASAAFALASVRTCL